jgi:hypothetical protein
MQSIDWYNEKDAAYWGEQFDEESFFAGEAHTIPALTLWQPYASFMASRHKTFETRKWKTKYRGPIAIHAAQRWTRSDMRFLDKVIMEHPELADYAVQFLPLGVVLAEFNLIEIYPVEEVRDSLSPLELSLGDYSDNRFAWKMELIRVFEKPISAKGGQRIWKWRV